MPFCKVPAPVYHHQYVSVTKATATTNHTNDVVSNVTGARRIRAPLRHSVEGVPPPPPLPTTTGISSTTTRQNFRSSYADPAVANGADPYVKISSRDLLSNGGCSDGPVSVRAMTSSLRPETTRLISNSSIDSCSTDSGRPASAGSSVVRQIACQIDLHSDMPTTPPPNNVDQKLRDRPEEMGVASEAIRVAIYRSSRAGWTRDQSAHRLWSSRNDPNEDATLTQVPPPTTRSGFNDGVVTSGTLFVSESLIAREIRLQREREEELMRQRRVSICGSNGDGDVTTGHVDDIDGLNAAADSNDSVDRDVISPSIVGRRSPAVVTSTGDRLVPVLARYQPKTQPIRPAIPLDRVQQRLLQERDQDTKKARSVLSAFLPMSNGDNVKPISTRPDVRHGYAAQNGMRAVSPIRPPQQLSRPPSSSTTIEPSSAPTTDNGNHRQATHPVNARNGHVTLQGGVGGKVESTMRKLASSRMNMELARDRQRERDVNEEKTGLHRLTPTPNGGASCGRIGGVFGGVGSGGSGKTPVDMATDESIPRSCGYIQPSSQRSKMKQITSSGHHRVAFSDELQVAKSPKCGQVLTSVRSSFIEKEINDLRNREEELRRQRESSFNPSK